MTDDFSKYPKSIGEIRSDQTRHAKDWTPREALINALRDIDSGEIDPKCLVILHSTEIEPGITRTGFYACSPDPLMTFGCIELGKQKILKGGEQ